MMTDQRLTDIEVETSHIGKLVEELNDVVTSQGREIDRLTRRVQMLMERLASDESAADGTVPLADQPPPHW